MTPSNNPDQFKLFMTGTEWKASITHSTDGALQPKMDHALAESKVTPEKPLEDGGVTHPHGAGLHKAMRTTGYKHNRFDPPTIVLEASPNGKDLRHVQSEGHHRVAAAADIEARGGPTTFIPTNYVDTTRARRRT